VSGWAESDWAALPLGRGVTLLTRDANGLAALAKPAGVLSHPNAVGDAPRALLNAAYSFDGECFEWNGPAPGFTLRRLWLLNRLDSATSGVILVAADGALAAAMRLHFQRREVHKVYNALVFGKPGQTAQIWQDKLEVKKHAGKIRGEMKVGRTVLGSPRRSLTKTGEPRLVRDDSPYRPSPFAETRMTVLSAGPKTALLRLEPLTGRSHQLRVQCAERGRPIVGDATYGDFKRNREFAKQTGIKRLLLHSLETHFEYEFGGKTFFFSAKALLPPEFEAVL